MPLSDWFDVPDLKETSQHTTSTIGYILGLAAVEFVLNLLLQDDWSKNAVHAADQLVMLVLVFTLVVRILKKRFRELFNREDRGLVLA